MKKKTHSQRLDGAEETAEKEGGKFAKPEESKTSQEKSRESTKQGS